MIGAFLGKWKTWLAIGGVIAAGIVIYNLYTENHKLAIQMAAIKNPAKTEAQIVYRTITKVVSKKDGTVTQSTVNEQVFSGSTSNPQVPQVTNTRLSGGSGPFITGNIGKRCSSLFGLGINSVEGGIGYKLDRLSIAVKIESLLDEGGKSYGKVELGYYF